MSHDQGVARVWVLLSGGLDSTACVDFYVSQGYTVEGVFIDYSQAAAVHERSAARSVARHYGVSLKTLTWSSEIPKGPGEILGRNAFFIFGLAMEIGSPPRIIATGLHSGTLYYDCSAPFLRSVQEIIDGYAGGKLRVAAPFLSWDKRLIWEYSISHNVPIEMTYSCERGLMPPCGDCHSCKDLEALRALPNHHDLP